eukprot:1332954-Rhodomonas_salina.1
MDTRNCALIPHKIPTGRKLSTVPRLATYLGAHDRPKTRHFRKQYHSAPPASFETATRIPSHTQISRQGGRQGKPVRD